MMRVNLFICDMMDRLRDPFLPEEDYLRICRECIEYNDVRFRVKNKINNVSNSSLREQKSYAISKVVIHISDDIVNIDEFIRPIKYFSLLYDTVVVISNNSVLRTEFNKDITVKFDEMVDDYKHMFLFPNTTYNKTEIYEIFKLNEAYLDRIIYA